MKSYLNDPDERRDYIARLSDADCLILQALEKLPPERHSEIEQLQRVRDSLSVQLTEVRDWERLHPDCNDDLAIAWWNRQQKPAADQLAEFIGELFSEGDDV